MDLHAPASSSPELDAVIRAGMEQGRAEHGAFDLSYEVFVGRVRAMAAAQLGRVDLAATPGLMGDVISRLALADLYLASACEVGDERAWDVFHTTFRERLAGLAVRRGANGAEAETLAREILGEMALPAPAGRARTLLGTYDGSGSLWAWLAVIVARRFGRVRARQRPVVALDPKRDETAASPDETRSADPWRALEDAETAQRLRTALDEAWKEMSEEERLVLLLKHEQGLRQRQIAELLGEGESRVSRLIARSIQKVRAAVERQDVAASRPGEPLWAHLRQALSSHLARSAGGVPPPAGRAGRGPA